MGKEILIRVIAIDDLYPANPTPPATEGDALVATSASQRRWSKDISLRVLFSFVQYTSSIKAQLSFGEKLVALPGGCENAYSLILALGSCFILSLVIC